MFISLCLIFMLANRFELVKNSEGQEMTKLLHLIMQIILVGFNNCF